MPYQPERLFQTRIFTGGLEPCGGGSGVAGGELEGWKVTGTREGAYKIEPTNVQVICLGDSATFHAKETGLDEESSWVSAPSLGTLANGISVTLTPANPNTYLITGSSLTPLHPSDTAVLTVLKVEIVVDLEDQEVNGVRSGLKQDTLKFDLNGNVIPNSSLTLLPTTATVDGEVITTKLKVTYVPSCSELNLPGSNTVKVDIDDVVSNHMVQVVNTFIIP